MRILSALPGLHFPGRVRYSLGYGHLDYSFTVSHPDGSALTTGTTPGSGGAELRAQFGFLRKTLEAAQIWELAPMNEIFASTYGAVGAVAMGLAVKRYVIYDDGDGNLSGNGIGIPVGEYQIRWLDPVQCREIARETRTNGGSNMRLP